MLLNQILIKKKRPNKPQYVQGSIDPYFDFVKKNDLYI